MTSIAMEKHAAVESRRATTLANACCVLLGRIVLSRQGDDVGPIENVLLHVEISFRMWMKQKHVLSILVICFFVSSSFRSSSSQFCTEKAVPTQAHSCWETCNATFLCAKEKAKKNLDSCQKFPTKPCSFSSSMYCKRSFQK